MPGSCISLSGSTQCPAFDASISTDPALYKKFPFLKNVSNLSDFDQALSDYVLGSYVKEKYVNILGCDGVNLSDTDNYYARYTTSVVCNGLVQSSKNNCNLSEEQSRPLCANTCALMATSEEKITINDKFCSNPNENFMKQIRADFTVCALPADSLTGTCISGEDNEPKNCGYGPNTMGLCGFCGSNSPNSTDPCCENSNAASKCADITVPVPTSTLPPIVPTTSSNSTAGAGAGASDQGLSGGQIAGIVIGSVGGAALIAVLIALVLLLRRRRRGQKGNGLNQPNPQWKGSPSLRNSPDQQSLNAGPVGRVTRMSALREVVSHSSPDRSRTSAGMFGDAKYSDLSDSDGIGASPGAMSKRIPPVTGKRHGSLSSSSVLAAVTDSDTSPRSGTVGQYSSPEGMTSGQSEQLSAFRDYYSQDDMHPGDKVSVLWAYQPRAGDEFELDRGEMLKLIGIWDDGWATGVRIPEGAEEFDERHREQRDSGVSNGSQRLPSPGPTGEIKAFPLVCVCLPQHWRKIIEGASQSEGELSDEGTG